MPILHRLFKQEVLLAFFVIIIVWIILLRNNTSLGKSSRVFSFLRMRGPSLSVPLPPPSPEALLFPYSSQLPPLYPPIQHRLPLWSIPLTSHSLSLSLYDYVQLKTQTIFTCTLYIFAKRTNMNNSLSYIIARFFSLLNMNRVPVKRQITNS